MPLSGILLPLQGPSLHLMLSSRSCIIKEVCGLVFMSVCVYRCVCVAGGGGGAVPLMPREAHLSMFELSHLTGRCSGGGGGGSQTRLPWGMGRSEVQCSFLC